MQCDRDDSKKRLSCKHPAFIAVHTLYSLVQEVLGTCPTSSTPMFARNERPVLAFRLVVGKQVWDNFGNFGIGKRVQVEVGLDAAFADDNNGTARRFGDVSHDGGRPWRVAARTPGRLNEGGSRVLLV